MDKSDTTQSRTAKLRIEFTLETGDRQRITYEPRTTSEGYWRITEHYVNGMWRVEGREPIQTYDVAFEALPPPIEDTESPQSNHVTQTDIIDAENAQSTAQPDGDNESN